MPFIKRTTRILKVTVLLPEGREEVDSKETREIRNKLGTKDFIIRVLHQLDERTPPPKILFDFRKNTRTTRSADKMPSVINADFSRPRKKPRKSE